MVDLIKNEKMAREHLCLPLDNIYKSSVLEDRVEEQSPYVGWFKIGFGSFTRFGHDALEIVQNYGSKVFFDLKFDDIKNTIEDASEAAAQLAIEYGVDMFNVHTTAGYDGMVGAVEGVKKYVQKENIKKLNLKILGVTILTSLDLARFLETYQPLFPGLEDVDFRKYAEMKKDDNILQQDFNSLLKEHNLTDIIQREVYHLANLSVKAGLDGIICSALDLEYMTSMLPSNTFYGTPGVTLGSTPAGLDQKRTISAAEAIQNGSNLVIAGRAITDPRTPEQIKAGVEVTPVMRTDAAHKMLQNMSPYVRQVA